MAWRVRETTYLECEIPQQNSEACRSKPFRCLTLHIYCHLKLEFKHCDVLLLGVKYEQKHDISRGIQYSLQQTNFHLFKLQNDLNALIF